MEMPYKRILIKLSGEMLLGSQPFGVNEEACAQLASALHSITNSGHELAVVIGGGNIFRGINLHNNGMERTQADHMGMLATLINGIALQEALKGLSVKAKVMTALECPKIAESFNWDKANQYLSEGNPVIFVGGTGSPYFTTDTAAALRASEMSAHLLLKATKVNGVYNQDPKKNPQAVRYEKLSYTQYLSEKLGVMDATAVALCMSSQIPIFVFSMENLGQISIGSMLADSKKYGTWIQ